MSYLLLYYEFFKVGLFSIGGGLATLPFLYKIADKYTWLTPQMVSDMLAVSESTPGPIGINIATYTGYMNLGVIGGVVATLGEITPSIIVIILVSKFLERFKDSRYVRQVFSTLRPTVTGLILSVAISLLANELLNLKIFNSTGEILTLFKYKELILFIIFIIITNIYKKHPIVYIGCATVIGIVFKF